MAIGYEWRLHGRELAGGGCADGVAQCVEDVADSVQGGLRRHFADKPEVLAAVLTNVWGPLRHSMLTDGVTGLRDEKSWTGSAPGLTVRLWRL